LNWIFGFKEQVAELEAGFTKSAEIDSTPFLTTVGGVPVGSLMGTMEEGRSKQTVDLAARGELGAALSLIESTIGSFGPFGLKGWSEDSSLLRARIQS